MNLEKYVLGSELAEKGNFNIANISMLIKNEDLIEGDDFLKFGSVTLIKKTSPVLPNYIKKVIEEQELTDLTGLLPKIYISNALSEEVEPETIILNEDCIEDVQPIKVKTYLPKISGMYKSIKVHNKNFVKITDPLLAEAFHDSNKGTCLLDPQDFPEAYEYTKGNMPLGKEKFLGWY